MKISLLLSAAAVATAFVVPDESILAVFANEDGIKQQQPLISQGNAQMLDASVEPLSAFAYDLTRYVQEVNIAAAQDDETVKDQHGCHQKGRVHKKEEEDWAYGFEEDLPHDQGFFGGIKKGWKHMFDRPRDGDDDEDVHHPHHGGHGHAPTKTIYELISGYEHTKVFTHVINQYDEVVHYLNSTEGSNYTIFVPLDSAFRHWEKDPHFPKEVVLKWLEYHVSPNVYTKKSFFNVQTVPTYLKQDNESGNPQRISTQVGLKGLTLNFHPRVVKSNIFATNGVIHALDEILILPLPAKTTIDLVPSVFSTLNLGLIKTGLIDVLDPEVPKSGGTFFAPTNLAFAKLGPHVNAFLFSRYGQKYLKALLKYHIVANHTLFSDAYYPPKKGDGETELLDGHHIDLPTLLNEKYLSVDIRHFHRFSRIILNGHVTVSVPNVPVQEGVIHLVSTVIIPPHKHKKEESFTQLFGEEEDEMITIEALTERLEPYLE